MTLTSQTSWIEPTQKRSQEKVARILSAAGEALARGGLSALKMTEVAKAADVSVGTLYQYFPSETALIGKLFAEEMKPFDAAFSDMLKTVRSERDFAQSTEALLDTHISIVRSRPVLLTLWRSTGLHPAIQQADAANTKANAALLDVALADCLSSGITPESRRSLSLLICQLWSGYIQLAVEADDAQTADLKTHFSGMLISYLRNITGGSTPKGTS